MKSVAIIIPYFSNGGGKKLPNEIDTFLKTCSYNSTIDWLLFTNWKSEVMKKHCIPNNVKLFSTSLKEIKNKAIKILDKKDIYLDKAYKLCDYKPMYGELFTDYLKNYDYWGYSDIDVIYGNLRKFINKPLEENYDKIGNYGHLTLFRNDKDVNHRYLLPFKSFNGDKESFTQNVVYYHGSSNFDEMGGINLIYKQYKFPVYEDNSLLAEVRWTHLDNLITQMNLSSIYSCWCWDNGKTIYFYKKDNQIKNVEKGYFHFQKRYNFTKFIHSNNYDKFIITNQGYQIVNNLDENHLEQYFKENRSSFIKRLKYYVHIVFFTSLCTRKHIGKLYLPVKYLMKRTFKEKKFNV